MRMQRQSKWSGKTIGSQGPKKGGGTYAKAEQVVWKDHRVSRTQAREEVHMLRQGKWSGRTIGSQGPKKEGGTHAKTEQVG